MYVVIAIILQIIESFHRISTGMERKDKNQKRKIIIFWLVFVIVGLLLILGFALYFSNKTVAKQTYNIQTDIELDSDSGVVVPSIVILEGSYESHPAEPEVTPTEKQEPIPVVVEPTPTTEAETETEQEVKQEIEAEVLEPVEEKVEVEAEVIEPVEEKVEIKAEVIESVEEKVEIKAEVIEPVEEKVEIKAEVLEPASKSVAATRIEFSESQVFEDEELQEIVEEAKKDHEGEDLVDTVVERVNEEYKERGYEKSVAYASDKNFEDDGVARIELVEPEEQAVIEFSESKVFEEAELQEIVKEAKKDHKGEDLVDTVVEKVNEKYEEKGYKESVAYASDKNFEDDGVARIELVEPEKMETGKGFVVKKIEFSESQIFRDDELDAIVEESRKEHDGIDLLFDVVDRVNNEYEEKGYPNAVAYIPEQTAKDGVFKIELVEGKLGSFTVVDNNFTFDAYYLWRFHFNRKKPLNLKDFEHQLILFNKWNDGYAATATISPGKTAGTSDITLNAKETHPLSIIGVYDNYGSEGTGKLRVGAHLILQSLLKMRDTLQAGIIANTAFNAPYVDYSILTPSLRLRIGARYSVGNSEVVSDAAKDYKIKGSNVSQSAYFSVPIMEASALQFTLTGSANYLHSKSIAMDEIILSEITVTSGQIGGTYVYSPENAYLVHTVNLTKAVPYFDANSSFTKIDGSFNFNFGLFKLATLILKAQYQLVIDSDVDFPRVMYMQAGGATTVRGYAEACNEGKDGFIGNAELRLSVLRSAEFNIDLFGFADYAFVVPEPDHKENTMWSWGIGADVDLGAIHASAVYGWPQINLTQDPNATNGRLHIAIKLAPVFSNK